MTKTVRFKKKQFKKAFSLIELSIVILIIGLLMAGILSGKSLIASSRLSSARSTTLSSQISTISGMVAWFEPSLKDSFLNNQMIDGGQVSKWFNIEPSRFLTKNNLSVDPASLATAPVYEETSTNLIPALDFSGGKKISLARFDDSGITTPTIFIVFKPTSSNIAGTIFDAGSDSTVSSNSISITSATQISLNTVDFNLDTSNSIVKNQSYILATQFNASNSKVFLNNVVAITSNITSNGLDGITIGAKKDGTNGFTGEISEVIVYNRILKTSEINDVMSYLSKKYKITVGGL